METRKEMPQRGRRIGKDAWVHAARDALIKGGIEAIKVERLAKTLKATRAAFYWHFTDRDHLLLELLDYWKAISARLYEQLVSRKSESVESGLDIINTIWLKESALNPAFDSAMRDWARISEPVAHTVRSVDHERIDIIKRVFGDHGYEETEALIRARITYFYQVGYITLGLNESEKTQSELAPIYRKVLLGR